MDLNYKKAHSDRTLGEKKPRKNSPGTNEPDQ